MLEETDCGHCGPLQVKGEIPVHDVSLCRRTVYTDCRPKGMTGITGLKRRQAGVYALFEHDIDDPKSLGNSISANRLSLITETICGRRCRGLDERTDGISKETLTA